MSVGEWRSASPAAQAGYFRGAVSVHIAEPAQNDAQRRFDDDLALDLRDCVTAETENPGAEASDPMRRLISACFEASGMAPPG